MAIAGAGIGLRVAELGTWGLSNDEAWVALATRVEGLEQFRLAIAMTPVAWSALVKLVAVACGGSELALRSVPFGFGCLCLWAAWRGGTRFAGHPLGGLLALAAVAFDPLGIAYAKVLKQYTAEAFFCLVALDRAAVVAERGGRRALVVLSLVLAAGLAFANSQLFLAAPVSAALLVEALRRRDGRLGRDVLLAAAAVGLWDALYYRLLVGPRLPSALDPYWAAQTFVPASLGAARVVWERLGWALGPALGRPGVVVATLCLSIACALPRQRVAGLALAGLTAEIALASMVRILPVSQPRILIFLTTALAAYGAAAVAVVVVRAWARPAFAVVAGIGLAVLARGFAVSHEWRGLARSSHVEDAGPLVRLVERDRQASDTVLLHETTLFIHAYYQRATPVLDPLPSLSVGYVPRVSDTRVVLVNDGNLEERARAAISTSPRVWFLASRLRGGRERRLREILSRLGTTALDHRRPGAILLLLTPREAPARSSPGGSLQ